MYNDKTWDRNKLKCPQCQYTCEYRSNLNRHTKSKHTNLVKLKCANQNAQCTFLMKTINILNVHIVIRLIGGQVLVCHLKQWDSVMSGEVTRPFG